MGGIKIGIDLIDKLKVKKVRTEGIKEQKNLKLDELARYGISREKIERYGRN